MTLAPTPLRPTVGADRHRPPTAFALRGAGADPPHAVTSTGVRHRCRSVRGQAHRCAPGRSTTGSTPPSRLVRPGSSHDAACRVASSVAVAFAPSCWSSMVPGHEPAAAGAEASVAGTNPAAGAAFDWVGRPRTRGGPPYWTALLSQNTGGDLLSREPTPQVPSALAGLTSVFGMGTGGSPPLSPPEIWCSTPRALHSEHARLRIDASPRPISTGQLNALLRFHFRPINLVFFQGSYPLESGGRSHLGGGFALRCFQRLSVPYVANQPCPWQDNWHTRGTSNPVLSYYGQLPSNLLRLRRIGTELSHDVLNPARVPL